MDLISPPLQWRKSRTNRAALTLTINTHIIQKIRYALRQEIIVRPKRERAHARSSRRRPATHARPSVGKSEKIVVEALHLNSEVERLASETLDVASERLRQSSEA